MSAQVTKKLLRIIVYGILGLVFLLASAFLVLQLPSVQSFLVNKYLGGLTEKTGYNLSIGKAHLMWFDRLQLRDVVIDDPSNTRMLEAGEILINFKLSNLYEESGINIDGIKLDSTTVHLTPIDTSGSLNITAFIEHLRDLSKSSGKKKKIATNIGEAILSNCEFIYARPDRDSTDFGFDPNHFRLLIDEAQLQNFTTISDTIGFQVQTLIAQDTKTGLRIKELRTYFRISQSAMEFSGLELRAGNSIISDTVILRYEHQRDLSDFINKVTVDAHLKGTRIDPADLSLFAPAVSKITQPVTINGKISGRVNRFRLQQMKLGIGNTQLVGEVEMDGLPDFYETFIMLDLDESTLDFRDLSFLIKAEAAERLMPLGPLTLNGQFIGYPTDFVAKGDFRSPLGRIISDINLKVDEESFNNSSYSGSINLRNFNLGSYTSNPENFQEVTLNGKIEGYGLTIDNANFKLDGTVSSLGFKGYNYQNIQTNAQLASGYFLGKISVDDPNLRFTGEGSIDLRNDANELKFTAEIDTVNFNVIGLSKDTLALQAKVDVSLKGLTLEDVTGWGDVRDISLRYRDQYLYLDTLSLHAEKENNQRSLELNTTALNARISGNFSFDRLFSDIRSFGHEIYLNLRNDKDQLTSYYAQKELLTTDYKTDFLFSLKDVKPVIDLLKMDIDIGQNTTVEGSFTSGYTSILNAYTQFDTLRIGRNTFFDTEVEVSASKLADSSNVLAMAYVSSPLQYIGGYLQTTGLIAETIWDNNLIDFSLDVDQRDTDNKLRLGGTVAFEDSTLIRFENSSVELLGHAWQIDPRNTIRQKGVEWSIRDLRFTYSDQLVLVSGKLSQNPSERLAILINNFDLSTLNSLIPDNLKGTLNARMDIYDYASNLTLENQIDIKDLYLNNFMVGNITGNNLWDAREQQFAVDFFIDRNDLRIVNLTGYYKPSESENPLNLKATFDNAELRIFESLFDNIFSDINGKINGTYTITGSPKEPEVRGEAQISDAQFSVNYLKTLYKVNGTVRMTPTAIGLQNFVLTDVFGNRAFLDGTLTHTNFASMRINLDASFTNFQLLNTSLGDNDLFYGQGYGTGTVNFFGPLSNLVITSSATTNRNTRIYVPVSGSSSLQSPDYINFVNLSDSTFQRQLHAEDTRRPELSGIVLNLDINVTPDAYCEIIFDIRSGDIIRGRGTGDLHLQINTNGEFNMFGPIEFTEGGYNFTIPYEDITLVNKEFIIQRGSRITWYGDPYAAELDVTASYNQLASLAPIITDQSLASSPQLRRKYPVQVLLLLKGPMLSPDISFDISADNLPSAVYVEGNTPVRLDFEFEAFKNKLLNDEQERNRQVFSLIILRRFSPPDAFNTSGTAFNSLSELLSNQLSYWLTQVDENLEIDVDLGTLDEEAFNTFQLRLSYSFLGGRLRVTRDGTLATQSASTTTPNNDLATLAGDWTVDYLLTADGKFKVKMYNRTNANPVQTNPSNQLTTTAGISLQHTQSFDQIKDLWKSTRNKRSESQEEQPEPESNLDRRKEDEISN